MSTTPTAGYFVMMDYEKSADYLPTIEAARARGVEILNAEPFACSVSIHDDAGDIVEEIGTRSPAGVVTLATAPAAVEAPHAAEIARRAAVVSSADPAAATPGRMRFHEDGDANTYSMIDEGGRWWLALLHNGEAVTQRQRANMRRLAAAWNACEGIPTAELEARGQAIDPDTGEKIKPPPYLVIGGNAYWSEPLPSGANFLMTAPLAAGAGVVCWTDGYEVDPDACPDYEAILARVAPL